MQVKHEDIHYFDDDALFEVNKKLPNGIQIKAYIWLLTDDFRDYQKDILQEFVADLSEQISETHYDADKVKSFFEEGLQTLNTKLKSFADKMEKTPTFQLKWFAQIVMDNVLMTSMIGEVSIMILRNSRLYYSLHNTTESQRKISYR